MRRYALGALMAATALIALSEKDAYAQTFYDGCPADYNTGHLSYWGSGHFGVGIRSAHINRPGCPWSIVDMFGAQGKRMAWGSAWAWGSPSTAAQCNGAKMSYAVARKDSPGVYTVVGSGTIVGQWFTLPWGGSGCAWNVQSGSYSTLIENSPYDSYRLLLRAWNPNGTEREASGYFEVNHWVD